MAIAIIKQSDHIKRYIQDKEINLESFFQQQRQLEQQRLMEQQQRQLDRMHQEREAARLQQQQQQEEVTYCTITSGYRKRLAENL